MPRRRRDHPISPADHDALLAYVRDRLPGGHEIMVLGNAALQIRRVKAAATMDLDVFVARSRRAVSTWGELVALAKAVDPDAEPARDQASILLRIPTAGGAAEVDLIYGRRRPGRFLTRDFLEEVAGGAERIGEDLVPRDEALAVMKAWAVVDQQRRADVGDQGRASETRRQRFLADLGLLRDAKLARGEGFGQTRLRRYLGRVRPSPTRRMVEKLLAEEGILIE